MPSTAATVTGRERQIEHVLLQEWRMIERVELMPCGDGGFAATIHLNQFLVDGAAEQQGLGFSPATAKATWERRLAVISDCVEKANAGLPAVESIREFVVV